MPPLATIVNRKGARRKAAVPPTVLACLNHGEIECANLMEWLAADMAQLAETVARQTRSGRLRDALLQAGPAMRGRGIIARLQVAGGAISAALSSFDSREFRKLAHHRSDLVRQWACYAVNSGAIACTLDERLQRTLPFADDPNMTVREAAWMAFRPHLADALGFTLELLERTSLSPSANIRRFAVEVSRPRSVWGHHISRLKHAPHLASRILENVRSDSSPYVQLAAGNWLNDASKSSPVWVLALCARWTSDGQPYSERIVKRALRTLASGARTPSGLTLFDHIWTAHAIALRTGSGSPQC